jgi:predicted nucleic acid-binding protein
MTTAVDTSVLISIAKNEPDANAWIDILVNSLEEGDLVISDVVAAEFFAALMSEAKFQETLTALGIAYTPTSLESAQKAGSMFRQYRREGGPREHLIPDFLIAAHAHTQADQLAAIDRGYLRRYFPRLRVLTPV